MKPAIERQPVPDFLATRFLIATIILILIRPRVLQSISPRVWWTGGIAGVVLAFGYVAQTIGLYFATAAITGFLTGLYVVATPLLAWLMFRQRLNGKVVIAAILGLTGLGVISLNSFGIGIGEVWIIIGALFFALHIVVLGRWAPGADAYALTVVQLIFVTVVTVILTFADGDGYVAPPDTDVWIAVLITAVFATALAFLLQTWAQSKLDSSRTAIILTAEVPWAAGLAVAVGQETLAVRTIIGRCSSPNGQPAENPPRAKSCQSTRSGTSSKPVGLCLARHSVSLFPREDARHFGDQGFTRQFVRGSSRHNSVDEVGRSTTHQRDVDPRGE
jgi:drug/metabolite transporter (DMT)-like permease